MSLTTRRAPRGPFIDRIAPPAATSLLLLYVGGAPLHVRDVASYYAHRGVRLRHALSLGAALTANEGLAPGLVLVAEELRTPDDMQHFAALRVVYAEAVIVAATWRTGVGSQIRLLDAGADFIVPAPCPVDLLTACVRLAERRRAGAAPTA